MESQYCDVKNENKGVPSLHDYTVMLYSKASCIQKITRLILLKGCILFHVEKFNRVIYLFDGCYYLVVYGLNINLMLAVIGWLTFLFCLH